MGGLVDAQTPTPNFRTCREISHVFGLLSFTSSKRDANFELSLSNKFQIFLMSGINKPSLFLDFGSRSYFLITRFQSLNKLLD